MTITYVGAGASSTASPIVAPIHASTATGNLLVMVVHQKPTLANGGSLTTPSGWTLIASVTGKGGYSTSLAADTGNSNMYVLTKVAGASEGGTTVSVTVAQSSAHVGRILTFSTTAAGWATPALASAEQTSTPTSPLSLTCALGIASGDMLVWAWGSADDLVTNSYSAETITATGSTIGTVTEVAEWNVATGNKAGGVMGYAPVTAGAASSVTWGATVAGTLTNVRGPLVITKLREAVTPTTTYSAEVLADTPLVYMRLGGADSTAIKVDSSGNSRPANTVIGTLTYAQPPLITVDYSCQFTSPSALEWNNATWMSPTSITLEAWINCTNIGGSQYPMIWERDYSAGRSYQWRISPTGKLEFLFWTSVAGPFTVTSAATLVNSTTYHVAATYDSATGVATLYVNGEITGTLTVTANVLKSHIYNLHLGGGYAGAISLTTVVYFAGRIDEAAIYGTALSPARLFTHYNARTVSDAPTNDLWVWNGTTAVEANVTVWNGSTEIGTTVSVT